MPEDFELDSPEVMQYHQERDARGATRDAARRGDRPVTVPAWVLSRLVDSAVTDAYIAWLTGQDHSTAAVAEAMDVAEAALDELVHEGGE